MNKKQQHVRHLPKSQVAELFGWFSSALILFGYALLSLGVIDSGSLLYHSTFVVGSLGLAVITYRHRAFQSFTVNIFFGILALVALVRLIYFA
jgi:hypothetical protein